MTFSNLPVALPIITMELAVVLALLQAFLMFRVGNFRAKVDVPLGDGGNPALLRRIRAHGNLTENAAIVLLLLAFAEMAGAPVLVVMSFAGVFLISRLANAVALSRESASLALRGVGALGTVGSLVGLALTLFIVAEMATVGSQQVAILVAGH